MSYVAAQQSVRKLPTMRTVKSPLLGLFCLLAGCQPYGGLPQEQTGSFSQRTQAVAESAVPGSPARQRPGTVTRYAGHFDGGTITASETVLANGMVQFAYFAKPATCGLYDKVVVPAGSREVRFSGPSGDPPTRGLVFTRTPDGWKLEELGVGMHACAFDGELKRR